MLTSLAIVNEPFYYLGFLFCASADPVVLSYVYTLQFVLSDGTGWLTAGLYRDEAVSLVSHSCSVLVYFGSMQCHPLLSL